MPVSSSIAFDASCLREDAGVCGAIPAYDTGVFLLITSDPVLSSATLRVLSRYRGTIEVSNAVSFTRLVDDRTKCTGVVITPSAARHPDLTRLDVSALGANVPIHSALRSDWEGQGNLDAFVRWALANEACGNEVLAIMVYRFAAAHKLTPRETELLSATVAGFERIELAVELGISLNTLKYQARSIISKAHATSVEEIALRILRNHHRSPCSHCGQPPAVPFLSSGRIAQSDTLV